MDQGRRSTRQPSTPTDPHILEATSVWERPVDNLTAIEAVNELVHGLTDEQADIVLLRVVGGFSVEEVASMVDKHPGAVPVPRHRALRRFPTRCRKKAVTM